MLLSTTDFRTLVETASGELFQSGHIDLASRCAIENVNGHSSAVAENFYRKRDRVSDVFKARKVFDLVRHFGAEPREPLELELEPLELDLEPLELDQEPLELEPVHKKPCRLDPLGLEPAHEMELSPTSESEPHVFPAQWPKTGSYVTHSWGIHHPEYERVNPKRVTWTAEEMAYIRAWIDSQPVEVSRERLATRCLAAIQKDPVARAIFHEHHVLGSGRLRNGIDALYRGTRR